MQYRNATYNEFGTIDMEILHPLLGWIPFTATEHDTEEQGRNLFNHAKTFASIEPYTPPPPLTKEQMRRTMPQLTRRQLLLTLYSIGVTEEAVTSRLADDPEGLIEWKHATAFERLHPLIPLLGSILGIPEEQIDALWVWGASV